MHIPHPVEQDEAVDDSDFEDLYSDDSLLLSSAEKKLFSDEDFGPSWSLPTVPLFVFEKIIGTYSDSTITIQQFWHIRI